jgi:excisionase family DNA binding protein
MSNGHGHQPEDMARGADVVTDRDTAIVVTTSEAATLANVSPRTIRRWIKQGHLPAIDSERGQLVSPADLRLAAERARQSRGHGYGQGHGHSHDRGHGHEPPTDGADTARDTVTVAAISVAGRAQLDAIMQEWLAPLIDRIATLEREAGGLEAENQAKDAALATKEQTITAQAEVIAELRRRAEAAEAERDRLSAVQAAQMGQETQETTGTVEEPSRGLWARLGRWWRG